MTTQQVDDLVSSLSKKVSTIADADEFEAILKTQMRNMNIVVGVVKLNQ